jgi:hypothetical protein
MDRKEKEDVVDDEDLLLRGDGDGDDEDDCRRRCGGERRIRRSRERGRSVGRSLGDDPVLFLFGWGAIHQNQNKNPGTASS